MLKSNLLLVTTPVLLLALNAPTNLQVKATSKTTISLNWTDNSNEIGFKIFRDGKLISLTPQDATHFEDTNLKPNTTYTYLVYATDYVEDELIMSKNTYAVGEKLSVDFRYLHDDINWLAIFSLDENSEVDTRWSHFTGHTIGTEPWGGITTPGRYEMRALAGNYVRASYTFKVEDAPKTKKLIFAGDIDWAPAMAPNLIVRHYEIMKLPFDGYTVVGNNFTNKVMGSQALTYDYVMNETVGDYPQKVRELAGLYQGKDMFLTVKIKFPGDFWDDAVWDRITSNFGVIAKVAKDLGFKGIVFDDEADHVEIKRMLNFKFPTKEEINHPVREYAQWEKNGSEPAFVDSNAYRNLDFSFDEHIEKVIARYQDIMEAMVAEYSDIDVLVYHGPMLAHAGTFEVENHKNHELNAGNKRFYEFKGATFVGLKRGIGASSAAVHDMGESYMFRTDEQFARTYQWRKYNMAKDINNESLDPSYQWRIPSEDRSSWKDKVNVGHMVVNYAKDHKNYPEFNTTNTTNIGNVKTDISLALSSSDEYVIYYCQEQAWLKPGHNGYPYVGTLWENMVREAIREVN